MAASSTFGPVEVVAFAFGSDRVPDGVQDAVREVLASGVITLVDLAVVRRDAAGEVALLELEDTDADVLAALDLAAPGLAGVEDLSAIGEQLAPGTCAAVLVVEHTWARRVVAETTAAGGLVLAREQVPADVVNEVADLVLAAEDAL